MSKRKSLRDRRKFRVRPRNVTSRIKKARAGDDQLTKILGKEADEKMRDRKPEDPAGTQRRAGERAAGMKAWNLADDGRTYHVKSRSGTGFYTVRVAEDRESVMFCDCKGFSFRRNCKHAEAVRKRIRREGKRPLAAERAVRSGDTMVDRAKRGVWERLGWDDKDEKGKR